MTRLLCGLITAITDLGANFRVEIGYCSSRDRVYVIVGYDQIRKLYLGAEIKVIVDVDNQLKEIIELR